MTAPVIESTAPTPAAQSIADETTTAPTAAAPTTTEAPSADMVTFMIGMGIVAVVVLTMAAVGAIAGSAELLIASGIVGTAASLIGVRTWVSLVA